jgi:hypothetical protein
MLYNYAVGVSGVAADSLTRKIKYKVRALCNENLASDGWLAGRIGGMLREDALMMCVGRWLPYSP